jgi:hypothetical protein
METLTKKVNILCGSSFFAAWSMGAILLKNIFRILILWPLGGRLSLDPALVFGSLQRTYLASSVLTMRKAMTCSSRATDCGTLLKSTTPLSTSEQFFQVKFTMASTSVIRGDGPHSVQTSTPGISWLITSLYGT